METIKKNIAGTEFTFEVAYKGKRYGFAHDCKLFIGSEQIASARCNYSNRTYEAYRFQTVMLHAVDNAIEDIAESIKRQTMMARGWGKLTEARRNEIDELVNRNDGVKMLRALMKEVRQARYGTEEEREQLKTLEALNVMLEVLMSDRTEANSVA